MRLSLNFALAACLLTAPCLGGVASRTQGAPAQAPKSSAGQGASPAPAVGAWEGVLDVGVAKLRLVLRVKKDAAGGPLVARLDSPDQNALDLPLEGVALEGRYLHFVFAAGGGVYDGAVSRDGTEIAGHWKQGGNTFPLFFARAAAPRPSATAASARQTAAGASAAADPVTRGRVRLLPCGREGVTKDALCGRYEVFENRETKQGRKISLNLVVLPSLAERPAPDPVFHFVGGPGAAATQSAGAPLMTLFRRTRDVVLIDQRGTGESNPLRCAFHGEGPADMSVAFGEVFPAERVRACRAELEKVADLRLYTTPVAAADADEVREALGYERVNANGGSYGSTAALAYLRLYPQRVRTASVTSVAPTDFKMALPFARGVEASLERLFADCAAEAACKAAFPELRREFTELYERLGKEPAAFEVAHPATGVKQKLTLTRPALMEHLRALLYQPALTSALPLLIHEMHGGSYARFASISYDYYRQVEGSIARGMHLSVTCAESFPFISDEEIKRETAATFYGDARVRAHMRACELWPRGDVPAAYRGPFKTDVPVLMLSGEVDPVTPPWLAAAALPQYTRGRQVLIRYGTHATYDCTERLQAEFVERGTADGLDTSCVESIRRRPFITSLPAN